MYSFLGLLSALLISEAFALKYTDCGSKNGKIVEVLLSGCEDSDVCELKRGETYSYAMTFESQTDSDRLRAVVHGIVRGVSMPYPLPNNDACKDSGVECPLVNGNTYTYGHDIEINRSYPTVQADVKWELRDAKNENVACVLIPVKIVR